MAATLFFSKITMLLAVFHMQLKLLIIVTLTTTALLLICADWCWLLDVHCVVVVSMRFFTLPRTLRLSHLRIECADPHRGSVVRALH